MPRDILIRDVPEEASHAFRRGAASRGLTQAEYFARLVRLHESARQLAELPVEPDATNLVAETLAALGLQTVSA